MTVAGKEEWVKQLRTASRVVRFSPARLPPEKLEEILEAGCQTASPWNLQPWRFIVAQAESTRAQVLRSCPEPGPATDAPALVIGLGDPRAWKQAPLRLRELMQSGSLTPGNEATHLGRIQQQWSVGDTARVFAIAQTHAALQQILLTALACDICGWWIHEFDADGLARTLHIPDNLVVVGVLALGYCADRAALPTASLARTVFAEAYGLPWRKNGA